MSHRDYSKNWLSYIFFFNTYKIYSSLIAFNFKLKLCIFSILVLPRLIQLANCTSRYIASIFALNPFSFRQILWRVRQSICVNEMRRSRRKEMGNLRIVANDAWLSKIVPHCPTHVARRATLPNTSQRGRANVMPVNVYRMSQKKRRIATSCQRCNLRVFIRESNCFVICSNINY